MASSADVFTKPSARHLAIGRVVAALFGIWHHVGWIFPLETGQETSTDGPKSCN